MRKLQIVRSSLVTASTKLEFRSYQNPPVVHTLCPTTVREVLVQTNPKYHVTFVQIRPSMRASTALQVEV